MYDCLQYLAERCNTPQNSSSADFGPKPIEK